MFGIISTFIVVLIPTASGKMICNIVDLLHVHIHPRHQSVSVDEDQGTTVLEYCIFADQTQKNTFSSTGERDLLKQNLYQSDITV